MLETKAEKVRAIRDDVLSPRGQRSHGLDSQKSRRSARGRGGMRYRRKEVVMAIRNEIRKGTCTKMGGTTYRVSPTVGPPKKKKK